MPPEGLRCTIHPHVHKSVLSAGCNLRTPFHSVHLCQNLVLFQARIGRHGGSHLPVLFAASRPLFRPPQALRETEVRARSSRDHGKRAFCRRHSRLKLKTFQLAMEKSNSSYIKLDSLLLQGHVWSASRRQSCRRRLGSSLGGLKRQPDSLPEWIVIMPNTWGRFG